jgi:glutamine transport system permease protein
MSAWLDLYGQGYLIGLGWTALIGLGASAGAFVWGCVLLLLRLRGGAFGGYAVDAYTQLARNTPVLLPIFMLYFGMPLLGFLWPAAICGAAALIFQNGAYVSEILRGSLKAVEVGQFDAGKALGLGRGITYRKIILPQVLSHAGPALANQCVLLIKDTSLLCAIAVPELTYSSKYFAERSAASYDIYVVTALLYLTLIGCVELVTRHWQRGAKWRALR